MRRLLIFAALVAIVYTVVAALAYPHLALALLGLAVLCVLWRMSGGIASTMRQRGER